MKPYWIKSIYYTLKNMKIHSSMPNVRLCRKVRLAPGVKFRGKNSVGAETYFDGELGYASYIGANCSIHGKIGKYCSIGSNVRVICGKHPVDTFVSTHPMFFSTAKQNGYTYVEKQKFEEYDFCENSKYPIIIGSDVWVGSNVLIKAGVKVGDGAIIAMGAVVTHDVEPYSIVGGVPAKVLRYRFDSDQIEKLLALKWWDKSEEWIAQNADLFSDIRVFLTECAREEVL